MKFHLSNAQKKELMIRGRELTVLLPVLSGTDTDRSRPLEFAQAVLPRDLHELIAAAEWTEAYAEPTAGGQGMVGLIGRVVPDDELGRTWHVVVLVCQVTLVPRSVRGKVARPQWPGSVEFAGEVFPRKKEQDVETPN